MSDNFVLYYEFLKSFCLVLVKLEFNYTGRNAKSCHSNLSFLVVVQFSVNA